MNNIIERTWKQNSMVNIEDLRGMAFQSEEEAHTFRIRGVDAEGNAIALSGNAAGILMRPDHTDVALTCTSTGGAVEATLPAECYDVPGKVGITIFLTSGGQKVCIYAAIANVSRTNTGNVSPGTAADVVDLINRISAAVATIPADYSSLWTSLAPAFDASKAGGYKPGEFVTNNGNIYVCTVPHTGSWNASHFSAVNVGGELSRVSGAITETKDTITNKMVLVESENKWNPNKETAGVIVKNGTVYNTGTYLGYVYQVIPVQQGDVVRFFAKTASNPFVNNKTARWLCAYDSNMNVIESAGSNSGIHSYTVPEGVAYICPSLEVGSATGLMATINNDATSFIDYFDSYYIAGDDFVRYLSLDKTDFDSTYMDYSMVDRLDPSGCIIGKYMAKNGTMSDSDDYCVTDYMAIKPNETLNVFRKDSLAHMAMRFVCAYDADKNVIESAGSNSNIAEYTQTGDVAFIRATVLYRSSDQQLQPENYFCVATDTPSKAVSFGNEPTFKQKYMPDADQEELHVYLPPEIPVGVGRTIELYNELVCLEAEKYHLHYSCQIGVQYERKFSITGTTTGNYTLTLRIYNDAGTIVWTGESAVKVVANSISSERKIIPVGDSLTNLKSWLSEVQTLSNSKIKYIGTRGRSDSTIRHEGRSGMTALDYSGQFDYDFDSNYQGASGISGTVNPFYNGSRFSLSYYNTQQASTVGTADAVQLFLGTNDVFGNYTAEESAQHIKTLVDSIRTDNASIPIFVCNTIYRSNQNGYYSSGGQGFTAASGWAFDSDMKIMNFQNALAEALSGYTNVYIVPLSVCMDREYDFGNVPTPVNPRLTDVTIDIPNESVHPQNAGYMQIADVMYSSYIAHLT